MGIGKEGGLNEGRIWKDQKKGDGMKFGVKWER